MKNTKLKVKIEDKKMSNAVDKRGCGQLRWADLERIMKQAHVLIDDQCLETIRVNRDGFEFTTQREK